MTGCSAHPEFRATEVVNGVALCYECWNSATPEERRWYEKATHRYSRGLLTREELDEILQTISYHHDDPSIPVHLDD